VANLPVSVALVCPDKFRGTLTAPEAAAAMAAGCRTAGYGEVRVQPLADGGDGTLEVIHATAGGSWRTETVTGPGGDPVEARWLMLPGSTAVVEMARASGQALMGGRRDPLGATTRGTGELIAAALRSGARSVVVGMGGSATTDGGFGAVEVLSGVPLAGREITVACDVRTPFVDAAEVFGPQKGASPAQVRLLTRRLEGLVGEYRRRFGVDVSGLSGSGAAGGLAGGLAALGAELDSGFDVVAGLTGFDDALDGVDLVVTGEGCLDATSFDGKVVGEVLARAELEGVPHRAIVAGAATADGLEAAAATGDVAVLTLTDRAWDHDDAFRRAAVLVEEAAVEVARAALGASGG